MRKYGFNKKIKLKNPKEISRLFKAGKFLFSDHIKLLWESTPNDSGLLVKIGISVPKRYFKFAHQRNLIKRKLRENIRVNKNILLAELFQKNVNLFFIYKTDEIISFEKTNEEIIFLLNFLLKKISTENKFENQKI